MEPSQQLLAFVEARAVPNGFEDLDRGDNHWVVNAAGRSTYLRMIARTVHPSAASACAEASSLVTELEALGYFVEVTSRIGAAVATGPNQRPAGWRALLDLRLRHEGG